MRILTSKRQPSIQEISEKLEHKFEGHYLTKLFGFGRQKTIIVKKSTFVGAQISKYENEIIIEPTLPSIGASLIFTALFFDGLFFLFSLFFGSEYRNLNQELGAFIGKEYN